MPSRRAQGCRRQGIRRQAGAAGRTGWLTLQPPVKTTAGAASLALGSRLCQRSPRNADTPARGGLSRPPLARALGRNDDAMRGAPFGGLRPPPSLMSPGRRSGPARRWRCPRLPGSLRVPSASAARGRIRASGRLLPGRDSFPRDSVQGDGPPACGRLERPWPAARADGRDLQRRSGWQAGAARSSQHDHTRMFRRAGQAGAAGRGSGRGCCPLAEEGAMAFGAIFGGRILSAGG